VNKFIAAVCFWHCNAKPTDHRSPISSSATDSFIHSQSKVMYTIAHVTSRTCSVNSDKSTDIISRHFLHSLVNARIFGNGVIHLVVTTLIPRINYAALLSGSSHVGCLDGDGGAADACAWDCCSRRDSAEG
jgi:hypothetical protein